jgi:hypothetical protein
MENYNRFEQYENKICYYLNDKLHRKDGPAIEASNGTKYWCKEGLLHRDDGPAAEHFNGSKVWYKNGKFVKNLTY